MNDPKALEDLKVKGYLGGIASFVGNNRNISRLISRKLILFRHESGEYQELGFKQHKYHFMGIRQPGIESFLSRYPDEAIQITIVQ
jgi:hypothetical protein